MARTTKTRKAAFAKPTRKAPRGKILGLPIESDYIDTEGLELSDPDPKLTPKQQAKKDKKEVRTLKSPKQPKATEYTGPQLPATRVMTRRMEEFKNTQADCLLLIDAANGKYTFANTYKGGILPPSYRPEKYTYDLTEKAQKKLDRKIEEQGFRELDVTDWPTWITNAAPAKRTRKSK